MRIAACEKSNGTLSHRYPIRGSNHSSHSLLTAIRPAALTGSVISVPRAVPARRSLQTATSRGGSVFRARRSGERPARSPWCQAKTYRSESRSTARAM